MKKTYMITSILAVACLLTTFGVYYHLTAGPPEDLYDQVTHLNSAFERRALVRLATPEQKVKLWTRQIAFALDHETFTPDERKLVEASTQFLTVINFRDKIIIPVEFDTALATTFASHGDADLYRRTFIIPGNATASDGVTCKAKYEQLHPNNLASVVSASKAAFFMPVAAVSNGSPAIMCNCNWSVGCDSGICWTNPCRQTGDGCGPFDLSPCYYLCG